jgi:hypothetical protein
MHKSYKKIWLVIFAIFLSGFFLLWTGEKKNKATVKIEKNDPVAGSVFNDDVNAEREGKSDVIETEEKKNQIVEKSIADKIFIKVPFSTQAPFANWDIFHEEACEEAALLMIKYYLDEKKLNPEIAEKEIQAMLDYEIKHYGKYEDSNAQEIVELARDFYGIKNLKVVYDFSLADLQTQLSLNKPIIVPAAGRLLGNPNFKSPGPLYHNLVLVGLDGKMIIANDPGTRNGEGYQYDATLLYEAIHDFPGDLNQIERGRKAMIILE